MTKYWHFCHDDKRLGHKDGRHIKLFRKLVVKGEPEICKHGLHASTRIMDALRYAQGSVICRVILRGKIIHDTDKSVAQERTVVAWVRGDKILHEFACKCAERVLRSSRVTDTRAWNAIKVKRLWLQSEATDKELSAAARRAADAAIPAAAAYAARSATARRATYAATATAYDARFAAGPAEPAEEIWQNRVLTRMVNQAMRK